MALLSYEMDNITAAFDHISYDSQMVSLEAADRYGLLITVYILRPCFYRYSKTSAGDQ